MTTRTARPYLDVSLAVPASIALGWILVLLAAPGLGVIAYAVPLIVPVACVALIRIHQSPARRSLTTMLMLVTVTFVLSLNFRHRELGDTGLDWQNGTKFVVWSAVIALGVLRWRDLIRPMRRPLTGLSLAYASVALLSAAWSEVPAYTAASAIGVLAYLILACLIVRDLDEATILRVLVWSLAAYVLAGLLAGAVSLDVAWLAPSSEETLYRLQGFSGHPNTFGQQSAILLTLTAISRRMGIIGKVAAASLLIAGLAAIIASGSRTNLAAALVAWAIVALRDSEWRHLILLAGMALLATVLVYAAIGWLPELSGLLRNFSRTGAEGEIFTLTGRTELWAAAWSLIAEKPLLGWGYNGIEDVIAHSVSAGFEGTAINAHNMLLQGLASLGFVGSLPAFGIVGALCYKFLAQADPARDQIALFLIVAGLGEVGIAATPILLTMVVFCFFALDGERSFRAECSRGGA